MKKALLAVVVSSMMSSACFAQSDTTTWQSDVVENYLSPNKGNEITKLTNSENGSRWYGTVRLKGSGQYLAKSDDKNDKEIAHLQGKLRLRGKTNFTDDLGFVGDFWMKAQENYNAEDGETTNSFSGSLDDRVDWEQFRFGIESDIYGALMLAKHTATWALFTTDMGVQGLNDTQGDAGGKNSNKIIYKNQFDNNLFVNGSYDADSDIIGLDLGYQTSDIYAMLPDSYGFFVSAHNGQPSLENGANNMIVGNVDTTSSIKSDTARNRHSRTQYSYTLAGYKQFAMQQKITANISYSEMASGETAHSIKQRGYTEGGLGLSATASYQYFPSNFVGWSPIITVSQDEFGTTLAPELQYFFTPYMRVWSAYIYNSDGQDVAKLEFQIDL